MKKLPYRRLGQRPASPRIVISSLAAFVASCLVSPTLAFPPNDKSGTFTSLRPANRVRGVRCPSAAETLNLLARARTEGKPLLWFYSPENPSEASQRIFRHPLAIEAVNALFLPVWADDDCEQRGGKTIRKTNNPPVVITGPNENTLATVQRENLTPAGLLAAMVSALRKGGHVVPPYLALLQEETSGRAAGLQRTTLAMHCFWEGEVALGTLDGVIATTPGFVGTEEVVEVQFDPRRITYATLLQRALKRHCADRLYAHNETQLRQARRHLAGKAAMLSQSLRPDKSPKHHLRETAFRFLPLTNLQAGRINAAVAQNREPTPYLSPAQTALWKVIRAHPDADWVEALGAADFAAAWRRARQVALHIGGND